MNVCRKRCRKIIRMTFVYWSRRVIPKVVYSEAMLQAKKTWRRKIPCVLWTADSEASTIVVLPFWIHCRRCAGNAAKAGADCSCPHKVDRCHDSARLNQRGERHSRDRLVSSDSEGTLKLRGASNLVEINQKGYQGISHSALVRNFGSDLDVRYLCQSCDVGLLYTKVAVDKTDVNGGKDGTGVAGEWQDASGAHWREPKHRGIHEKFPKRFLPAVFTASQS